MTGSCPVRCGPLRFTTLLATIVFPSLLPFEMVQIFIQSNETLGPKSSVMLNPLRCISKWTRFELAWPPLGFAAARNKPCTFKHFQVLRDRRKAHLERLCKLSYRGLARSEAGENGTSRGIGKSGEGGAEVVLVHLI